MVEFSMETWLMHIRKILLVMFAILMTPVVTSKADDLRITSFGSNGRLSWNVSDTSLWYRVEWCSDLISNVWRQGYEMPADIHTEGTNYAYDVPMFYRVVGGTNRIANVSPTNIRAGVVINGTTGTFHGAVMKTGQTISYRTGDDGYYEAGNSSPGPRFTDNGDGTVTDLQTGLMWLKNACAWHTPTWSTAVDDCQTYAGAGYSDWRLPNISELQSLLNYGTNSPPLPIGHPFSNTSLYGAWWSSTTVPGNTTVAFTLNADGAMDGLQKSGGVNDVQVWPVRGP